MPEQLFARGDVVQIEYASPRYIEEWMRGERPVGPGDIGVVRWPVEQIGTVTVIFPMIGTFGVHSSHLRVVRRSDERG